MHPALAVAERILIIGNCGAGKSTLARDVGARLALPVIHLDAEYFQPGWIEPDPATWNARIDALIARERWVMDGCHAPSLARRHARADAVVWLDFSTSRTFWRVLKRLGRHYGRQRPDLAPGCRERLDLEFLRYVLSFRREQRPKLAAALRSFPGPVLVARTPPDVARLLE